MEFFKKSSPSSGVSQSVIESRIENKNADLLTSCRSAFELLEDTVDESVNAMVSGGTAAMKAVEAAGKECANAVEQSAKVVKDGIDLSETGVDNIMRLITMCKNVHEIALKYKHYLKTESIFESTIALTLWIFICYNFQVWMIPASILMILVKNYIQRLVLGIPESEIDKMLKDDDKKDMSVIEKLEAVEKIILAVKNILGKVELTLGKIFDVFDVYLPEFFWIVVLIQIVLTAVLMYIPVNYLLMLCGISFYAKRFCKYKTTNSNEESVGVVPKNVFSTFKRAAPDAISKTPIEKVSDRTFSKYD